MKWTVTPALEGGKRRSPDRLYTSLSPFQHLRFDLSGLRSVPVTVSERPQSAYPKVYL
jgi:hypothetical protein